MNKIPPSLRKELESDPFYKTCSLYGQHGHQCQGRITFEHTLTYAGKQLQEKWSIIPLCAKGHAVDEWQDAGTMDKELNVWVALNRATDEELIAISKAVDYIRHRNYLNGELGAYHHQVPVKPQQIEKPKYWVLLEADVEEYVQKNVERLNMSVPRKTRADFVNGVLRAVMAKDESTGVETPLQGELLAIGSQINI